jgi:hypothetical protein
MLAKANGLRPANVAPEAEAYLKELPSFKKEYQRWYTEAQAVIRQLITAKISRPP